MGHAGNQTPPAETTASPGCGALRRAPGDAFNRSAGEDSSLTKDGKIGIGIIGFGGIAKGAHAPGYRKIADQCEILAVADILPERCAEAKSEKWNVPLAFDDYKKILEMPEIDAVSVCTPNTVHMQPTLDALAAGKHVLCEKPMAISADEARRMLAAQKDSGKNLQIGYNMRFSSGAQALKRAMDNGMLGDVYHAQARAMRRRGVPGWGVFIDKEKNGGGPLIDIGVHITDMTLWLMGHPKPVAASGQTYTKFGTKEGVLGQMGAWDPKKYTVEDFATALIRFDNGATCRSSRTWTRSASTRTCTGPARARFWMPTPAT